MTKKKKSKVFKISLRKKTKTKVKVTKVPQVKRLTTGQIRNVLQSRQAQTFQKIINSPFASPISKARARRMLEKLK